jgi:MoaA/NifB/PqqE/SkfB family radical SAM enzyme
MKSTAVSIVHPKDKPLQRWLRQAVPGLYEAANVLNWRLKDRRYFRQQADSGVFDRLMAQAERPHHVEIETFNRCNSTCGFCPVNRTADPRPQARMSEEMFHSVIDQLAAWDYRGVVNLFSNNEPFLDKRIFAFTEYAREKLPLAFVQIISNGTALDVAKVERILPFLSRMVINNYGAELRLHDNVAAIVDHLNARCPDLAGKLTVGLRQLDEFKSNRGGTSPNRKVRTPVYTSRCAYPYFQMVIRPDGKISLCCNDALGQETLGDLATSSLRDAWADQRRRRVQDAMLNGRAGNGLCTHCDNLAWAKPKRIADGLERGTFTG